MIPVHIRHIGSFVNTTHVVCRSMSNCTHQFYQAHIHTHIRYISQVTAPTDLLHGAVLREGNITEVSVIILAARVHSMATHLHHTSHLTIEVQMLNNITVDS